MSQVLLAQVRSHRSRLNRAIARIRPWLGDRHQPTSPLQIRNYSLLVARSQLLR
ncbi:hypothetical protein [Altericista sp. CCNU0014]|uniref:hypothetical protein n=1 Tax=Altericista sp. CCNU0014 TaxID=3082949 RepID=UPI00384B880A